MPHTQPNFTPVSGGGGRLEGFNGIKHGVDGISNSHFGGGLGASSGSSGNSFNADSQGIRKSFWAQITRRLRFFNVPPLSYLRIPDEEKHLIPKSYYDVEYKSSTGVVFHRNPWESYDAYVSPVTGDWVEHKDNPYLLANNSSIGESYVTEWNSFYWRPKETRYVMYGDQKNLAGFTYPVIDSGADLAYARKREYERHVGYCPRFIWAYSWCQVIESLDLQRAQQFIFNLPFVRKPSDLNRFSLRKELPFVGAWPGPAELHPTDPPPFSGQSALPAHDCAECYVAIDGVSQGGMVGKAMSANAAYEVNNCRALVGTYVRMFQGDGNYFIFQTPQYPSRGRGIKLPNVTQSPYHFHSGFASGEL